MRGNRLLLAGARHSGQHRRPGVAAAAHMCYVWILFNGLLLILACWCCVGSAASCRSVSVAVAAWRVINASSLFCLMQRGLDKTQFV